MSYHNMITVYKIGHISWQESEDPAIERERAFQGICSLWSVGKWSHRYYQRERYENGAHPIFVFKELEDALAYWEECGLHQSMTEIWQAETSQLIEIPTMLPIYNIHWEKFWRYWLLSIETFAIGIEELMERPYGSWVCPDITLITRVYPEPEQGEAHNE